MITPAELWRRIMHLLHRDRLTAELEEEMKLHLELRETQLRECGLPQDEAHYAARRRFGHITAMQQRSRDMWGLVWLEDALADLRFTARRLRLHPGFSIAVATVAALGIGATTAVFSAVDAALVRPLPFVDPSRLAILPNVGIPFQFGTEPAPSNPHAFMIDDAATMHDVFSHVAAFAAGGFNLSDAAHPRRVKVGVVTANFFETLGAQPELGRVFDATESHPGASPSAVLSDVLWRARFASRDVIGKTIELSGRTYSIVGVMRPGFDFPNESELWIPLTVPTTPETFSSFRGFLPSRIVARLAPGVSMDAAASRTVARWEQILGPAANDKTGRVQMQLTEARKTGGIMPLRRALVGNQRMALIVLMGATALLLLIACANVANLLLSDAVARRREIALREVLGASRTRIVRQLLAESMLLAFAGATAGLALSPLVLHLLRAMMPADLAGLAQPQLNLRILCFATVLTIVTGLVFGIWPALGTARADAVETIKSGGLGATSARLGGSRQALVIGELALTVVLLVASGLMLRSWQRLMSRDMGMNPEHVGTLELSFAPEKPTTARMAELDAIIDRLNHDPGIQDAGVINDVPLAGEGHVLLSINIAGLPPAISPKDARFARYLIASGGYFRTLGIPLLRGRTFSAADDSLAPSVAVISSAMAKKWWPNVDPVGRSFRLGVAQTPPTTIVGVVADVHEGNLEDDAVPQMYFSIDTQTPQNIAVVARSDALPPSQLLERITDAVHAVDPTQAVYHVRTMDDVVTASVAPRSTNTTLIALFGMIAVMLSVFGVYGVVSYSVATRSREFGIRAALGATGTNIAALVGREMAWVIAAGLAFGLVGAWMLSRVMASLLFGVDSRDLTTFIAAPAVLIIPALVATAVPAVRAMRANPCQVMRAE